MNKIFTNVWPEKYVRATQEFSEEYIKKLLKYTDVELTDAFNSNNVVSLILLDQASDMQEFMQQHGINGRVGLAHNLSYYYPGWTLIVEADYVKGSINPLVSKFFRWERIESQSILSFDEIMEM